MQSPGIPDELWKPETFRSQFFSLANLDPPPHRNTPATEWFEEKMRLLANKHDLYCQNKRGHSEWMCVDHVIVRQTKTYADFPIIAVEHENGDLSPASKSGELPPGDDPRAKIEWAAWKVLTMKAKLHVLVAYPWKKDKDNALKVLARMVDGYVATFGVVPNALFLLGWWRSPHPGWTTAEQLYEAYTPHQNQIGASTTDLLPLDLISNSSAEVAVR